MLDIKLLEKNPYFEKIILEKEGLLFNEGDIDNNLYIVLSGKLSVQKYTTSKRNDSKQLAILKTGDIFGEGSLSSREPKQAKIISLEKSILLKIDAKKGIESFIKEFPKQGIELLTDIIDVTNKRLLDSNSLVTSNYRMSKAISEIELYDNKNLFYIIDKFEEILSTEYIIYLEKNPVIENYMTLKYDSRVKGKMKSNIIDFIDNKLDISDLKKDGIILEKYNHIEILRNENEIIGYLIIGEKDNNFSDGQKKVISSVTALIAGVIKQKQDYEEERNKEFMEE